MLYRCGFSGLDAPAVRMLVRNHKGKQTLPQRQGPRGRIGGQQLLQKSCAGSAAPKVSSMQSRFTNIPTIDLTVATRPTALRLASFFRLSMRQSSRERCVFPKKDKRPAIFSARCSISLPRRGDGQQGTFLSSTARKRIDTDRCCLLQLR